MKNFSRILTTFLLISSFSFISAQSSYGDWVVEAENFYKLKKYTESAEAYEKAFATGQKASSGDLYNAACSRALAGDKQEALTHLEGSVDAGWTSLKWMQNDRDLISLQEEKRWEKLVKKLEKTRKKLEKDWNKPLMEELADIGEKDQRHRKDMREVSEKHGWDSKEMTELWGKQSELDSLNQMRIVKIIDEYGYPGRSIVGDQSGTAFLVIQHADIEMQEKYLPLLKEAAEKGELRWSSLALLIDRVLLRQGKMQLYGSQLERDEETGGWKFSPIEDEPNVNKRREEVGLGPLEDYARRFGLEYTLPKK